MKKYLMPLVLLVALVSGCTSKNDVLLSLHDSTAIQSAMTAESDRVKAAESMLKSTLDSVLKSDGTAAEKILAMALLGDQYSDVLGSKVEEILIAYQRATLSTDVQTTAIQVAGEVSKVAIPYGALSYVANKAVENSGGVDVDSAGGQVNVIQRENHATNVGDGNSATTSTSRDTDNSSSSSLGE